MPRWFPTTNSSLFLAATVATMLVIAPDPTHVSAEVIDVQVTTSDGESIIGKLLALTQAGIEVDVDGKPRSLGTEELQTVKATGVEMRTSPPIRVSLVGGSQLLVDQVQTVGEQLMIEARRQPSLRVPMKRVAAIRFQKPSASTDAAWLGMLATPARGDRMVIRRPGDRLDPTDGIVESIGDGRVQFNLDGDVVPAPIDRLEGVILGGNDSTAPPAEIIVTDTYGSTWSTNELAPSRLDQASTDRGILVTLDDETVHEIPASLIHSIRWSSGLMMLASSPAVESTAKPYFASKVTSKLSDQWFGPQAVTVTDSGFEPGDSSQTDLLMHGGSSIVYRVEPGFRSLSGSVRRHPTIEKASGVNVRIRLDDREVWNNTLPNPEPQGFEIELGEARRVTFVVDSGDDGDLGAMVQWLRPRLLK